jgi:hypothetical protein
MPPSSYVCPLDDTAQAFVVGVIAPDDVPANHAGLFGLAGLVGAVEREVVQGCELRLDAVQPRGICRRVGDLDVVRRGPGADPGVFVRGPVRAEVVADDRDARGLRVEGTQGQRMSSQQAAPGSGGRVGVRPSSSQGEGERLVCFGFFLAAQPGQLDQRGDVDTGEDRVEGDFDQLIGTHVLVEPFVDCCHAQR